MKFLILIAIFTISLTFVSLLSTSRQFVMDAATFDSNLLPGADNIYDLGFDSSPRWKDASFSGNMLITGNLSIGTTTISDRLTVVNGNISQIISSTTPTQIGSLNLATTTNSIYISGKYAYLGSNYSVSADEFLIIDISNPTTPTQIGSWGAPANANINSIYVSGRYAYIGLSSGSNKFRIIDVSNPAEPTQTAQLNVSPWDVNSIYVSGKYAYLGLKSDTEYNEFQIIDVSNPTNPIVVGTYNLTDSINSIYISGRYAYIGTNLSTDSFQILDISNPVNPTKIDPLNSSSPVNSIYVSGRYAYIGLSSGNGKFRIIDVSNPANPTQLAQLSVSPWDINSIYVSGKYAYVGTNLDTAYNEFIMIDISSSTNPFKVGGFNTTGSIKSVFVVGKYAYIGSDTPTGEFQILDISGLEAVSAEIHSLEAGNLQVRNDIIAQGQLQVGGGVNIGSGGIFSAGPIGISFSSTTASTSISAYFQGRVGIATTTPSQKLEVNGGIRLFTGDAKPNCDATNGPINRGTLWFTTDPTANKDIFELCAKDNLNAYDWRKLF